MYIYIEMIYSKSQTRFKSRTPGKYALNIIYNLLESLSYPIGDGYISF
jgi:hypothetical protein